MTSVSLGNQNKQKANAPPGSKPQSNIILHMSDEIPRKLGSGWGDPWKYRGSWYHLGGARRPGEKKGTPTIYILKDDKWSSAGVDQSTAWILYEHRGR